LETAWRTPGDGPGDGSSGRPPDGLAAAWGARLPLALVADGRTNRQIATTIYISDKTASVHVSRILAKLGVTNRAEAAAVAHRLRLTG
jgi:Bacterial regulatory proteins, luxR family